MKDYQLETLQHLRSKIKIFEILNDKQLSTLYSKYSNDFHAAGWLDKKYLDLNQFYNWATKSPLDLILEQKQNENAS